MTWTYVRTLDSFTLAKERHIICVFWKWRQVLLRTSYGLQWYNFFYFHCWNQVIWMPMPLSPFLPLACKNPTSQVFSPLLSPCRENIRDIFCFQQLFVRSDTYVPCAARYVCTKVNAKSSYNQTEKRMKWWGERKQQLLPCRSSMRRESVVKYVPLV